MAVVPIAPAVIVKPWGTEVLWAHVPRRYCGKLLYIDARASLSRQYHERKAETLCVVSGEVEVRSCRSALVPRHEETLAVYRQGDAFHVPPGTVHRIAASNGPAVLVEASTDDLDDVVRLEDDYGRVGVADVPAADEVLS